MTIKANIKRIYRILFVLIAWFGVIGHFFQIVVNRAPEWSFLGATVDYFSYFTIQSNWLVAIWWTLAILTVSSSTKRWFLNPKVKGALTAYITVTFSIYALMLAKSWDPTGLDMLYSNITHYITPLAFILDWLLFEKRGVYQFRFAWGWMLYPVVYFSYALIYGAIVGKALYPFFNYQALGVWGMVSQVAFILVFFIALELIYITLNRLLGRWFPPVGE